MIFPKKHTILGTLFLSVFFVFFHMMPIRGDESISAGIDRILEKRLAEKEEERRKKDPEYNYQLGLDMFEDGDYAGAADKFNYVLLLDARHEGAASMRLKSKMMMYFSKSWPFFLVFLILMIIAKITEIVSKYKKGIPQKTADALVMATHKAGSSNNWKGVIDKGWAARRVPGSQLTIDQKLDLHALMAKAYSMTDKWDDAINEAQQAIRIKTAHIQAHDILVQCFLKKDDRSQDAIREYKRHFSQKPNDKQVTTILCEEYLKINLVNQDALDVYKKFLSWEPEDAKVNRLLAEAYLKKVEKTPQAAAAYEVVISNEPDNHAIRKLLMESYYSFKKWDSAIEQGKYLAENADINDTRIHKLLMDSFENAGKHDEMLEYYRSLQKQKSQAQILKDILEKVDSSLHRKNISDSLADNKDATKPSFNICPDCAHLNRAGAQKCEGCGKAFQS